MPAVIQVVSIDYGKAGRGGEGAQLVVTRGWGQLRTNQRIVTFEESWYREVIVNIARVAGQITGNVFAGAPTEARDLRRPIERRRKRAMA